MMSWMEASYQLDCQNHILWKALIVKHHRVAIVIKVLTIRDLDTSTQIWEKCTHLK